MRLQLQLRTLDGLKVRLDLGRQLASMLTLVLFQSLLVLDKAAARVLELRVEKLVRSFGLHFTIAQVFLDEQRRQPFGDLLRGCGIVTDEAHTERVAALDLDVDVCASTRSRPPWRPCAASPRRVEILNQSLQTRPAQNLLAQRRQTILDSRRHGRLHVALGHPLRE